ncbi:hypothetical protein LTR08_005719 [Meristemomyces frigidus]|nr:hypothetical protein LTR08_005719 [Meristemomyces frigidus]
MPHNWDYDIKVIRKQVASDIATFKLEKERLHGLQQNDTEDLQLKDRNVIINWSRASIADFNERLDIMEKIEQPSMEEKQVMQQLMELISLGDHIGDIQGEMLKRLDAKFGKVSWMLASDLPEGAYLRADGKMVIPREKEKAADIAAHAATLSAITTPAWYPAPASNPAPAHAPAPIEVGMPSSKPETSPRPPTILPRASSTAQPSPRFATDAASQRFVPISATVNDARGKTGDDRPSKQANTGALATDSSNLTFGDPDPKGIYSRLGLTPEAAMNDIKKAARSVKVMLHPDKNKDDPDAGVKFAEFTALYGATLEDEVKRQVYDSITPD